MTLLKGISLSFFLIMLSNLTNANISQKPNELTIGGVVKQNDSLTDKNLDGYTLEKLRVEKDHIKEVKQLKPLIINEAILLPIPIPGPIPPPTKPQVSPPSLCEINPKDC